MKDAFPTGFPHGQRRGKVPSFAHRLCNLVPFVCISIAAFLALGCAGPGTPANSSSLKIQSVNLNNLVAPVVQDKPVALSAAKNEWTSFQVQISGLPQASDRVVYTLRLQSLNLQTASNTISPNNFSAYQVLSMPVDANQAGYVRHTGLSAATRLLPRALLPMPVNDGRINLSAARDPEKPSDPKSHADKNPILLWIDLHIPTETAPGNYTGVCDVLASGMDKPLASVPVNLTVYNFVLPDERHLNLVGDIDWESLQRLFPDRFEAVTPRLVGRGNKNYDAVVKTLDQLVTMAEENRVEVVVPRLQPNVKWPGGQPPKVEWDDFDSVVGPWLKGDAFKDKIPLGYWPLPACDGLFNYDIKSRQQYWNSTATHFDQNDWLARCPVFLQRVSTQQMDAMDYLNLSSDAAAVLAAHPRVHVTLPLEDDQIQLINANNPNLIKPEDTPRILTANPGIVFTPPIQNWPQGVARPPRWMRTDLTGLIPYVGAGGDERDVRLWAWMSFLPLPPPQLGLQYGSVQFIRWDHALPRKSSPNEPADPNELVWFYPGSWFGVDQPVPTIQLKWLRRAQQDSEYLYLARQRGDVLNALVMARMITKPVELQPDQKPDMTFGLMCGTADPAAWDQAIDLLAQQILLHDPGQTVDKDKEYKLSIAELQWAQPQERPLLLGRSTVWSWDDTPGANWINLGLGIDIYNASDSTPADNMLQWTGIPDQTGWQMKPQPISISSLATYRVKRSGITAQFDPVKLRQPDRRPLEVTFTNGYNKHTSQLRIILPVAPTDRREGHLKLDGDLNDWSSDDAILDGPMVKMFNRPALQAQELQPASTSSQIFTGWADSDFYIAFKLGGLSQSPVKTVRNFTDYQFRRAWGEDLCEILIQPVFSDNTVGPLLHIVCKPTNQWIERKKDERQNADPWQPFEGTGLRYVAKIDGADWRGELAIPWSIINDERKGLPKMLRFNFSQHIQDTGEDASWAGPIDFGRDDAFTGVLVLREPNTPGMQNQAGVP